MFLVVDIGNSLIKYHFNRQTFFEIDDLHQAISEVLLQYSGLLGMDTFRVFLVSTKKSLNATEKGKLKHLLQDIQKTHSIWFPIEFNEELLEHKKLLKKTYKDLGDDRQIKTIGALKMFENMNIALFDFGSASTLTIANSNFEFKGGLIDIGFLKSFEFLNTGMEQLPELSHRKINLFFFDPPKACLAEEYTLTEQAILNGVYQRAVGAIKQWTSYAEEIISEPYTIACGYGSRYFAGHFDSVIDDAALFYSAFEEKA